MSVAFITGASRGIGWEIAHYLADRGWTLGLMARNPERLAEAADRLRAKGVTVATVAGDVTDFETVKAAVASLVEEVGVPDFLVNNAGLIDAEVPIWEADVEQWKAVLDTNLLGAFYLEHQVIPHMLKKGGGRILNMVTGAGTKDWGIFTAYTSSKAGLIRNVGDLHVSGYDLGLRAFGIAPGTVYTDMARSMELHANRKDFTPVENTLELIGGIIDGELDDWSGAYLRATDDTVESLKAAASERIQNSQARSLGIITWGEDDPLA